MRCKYQLLAHEIGHTIGINHNEAYAFHYGASKSCDGIMNAKMNVNQINQIADGKRAPWSSCAADFLKTPPPSIKPFVFCM